MVKLDFEKVWSRFTRTSSFVAGMAIMGYETVADKSDRPWLYAAAIGMMGLPVARAAESILGHWMERGPGSSPEQVVHEKPVVIQQPPQPPPPQPPPQPPPSTK